MDPADGARVLGFAAAALVAARTLAIAADAVGGQDPQSELSVGDCRPQAATLVSVQSGLAGIVHARVHCACAWAARGVVVEDVPRVALVVAAHGALLCRRWPPCRLPWSPGSSPRPPAVIHARSASSATRTCLPIRTTGITFRRSSS